MPVAPRPKKAAKVHNKISKNTVDNKKDYTAGIAKAPEMDPKKRKMPNYK